MVSNEIKAFLIYILNQNGPPIHVRDTQWFPIVAVHHSIQGRVVKYCCPLQIGAYIYVRYCPGIGVFSVPK